MKYSDLLKFKNTGIMEIDEKAFFVGSKGLSGDRTQIDSFGIIEGASSKAAQMLGTKVLALAKAGSGPGMWVPYIASRTVYDYLSGGQTWAASGPFSGCYIEVGQHDGKVYVAHVSCETAGDANVAAWQTALPGKKVLFSAKIGMSRNLPSGATNVAAIIFADVAGGAVEVTRVDVQTASAGSMRGPIFDVQPVVNAA